MTKWLLLIPCLALFALAACQPTALVQTAPTIPPFPTMTPGQLFRAALPPFNAIPLNGGFANPSTLVAQASQPTTTPNRFACPASQDEVTLPFPPPTTARGMELTIESFMTAGGTANTLDRDLSGVWNAYGGTGFVRGDLDITGEGAPDVVVSITTPDEGGTLIILACLDGRYLSVYRESLGGDAPALTRIEDMNADGKTDLLFISRNCLSGECLVITQLAGWSTERAHVVNLLENALESDDQLRIEDVDQDRVNELILQFTNDGDAQTGPLDTGFTVYDWDGFTYTSALTQLDPPRYLIQVIFQADESFDRGNYAEASALYAAALTSTSLEPWQPDDLTVLPPYALYRLLLAYAALEDPRLADTQQVILSTYADPATQPVYATLALTFWNAYQITNNLHSACIEVQSIMAARPEALTLLNRYGDRSPVYDAQSVCPL